MTAIKNKFETFRDWMITQDHYDLWSSDEVVQDIVDNNPRGKFKEYLKELKTLSQSPLVKETEYTAPVNKEINEPQEEVKMTNESVQQNELHVLSPEDKEMAEMAEKIDLIAADKAAAGRLERSMKSAMGLQIAMNSEKKIDKSAALAVSKAVNWASDNPKTAIVVGGATVVAAGVGIYHLAKMAKQYI